MWASESVFYQIYPFGACNAPFENDHVLEHRIHKLEDFIPHLKKLNIDCILLNPIFESRTHGYDTKDYKKVDRRLGDNEDFKEFVRLAHENGIRVVVDGVFNHTGREFFAFQDIQKNREHSPYCSWYKGVNFGWNSPYNDGFGYEAWRNCFELVNLNLYEQAVRDYLFDFMKEMRYRTGQWKEDFWLMGEVIHGDYARWVNDEMLHSTTNYELHKGLYSGHNDHNYFEIAHTIRRQFDDNGGIYRGRTLYSFVDNHDVDRLMSKLNNKDHIREVYTLLYTLPGIPSIYYGSEWGIEGRKQGASDDAMRPQLDLEKMQKENPHPELTAHIAALGKMRKENPVLADGKYRELVLTNRQYAYARIKDQDAIVVAANNDENPADMSIPVPVDGTYENAFTKEAVPVVDGRLQVHLDACESKIFRKK